MKFERPQVPAIGPHAPLVGIVETCQQLHHRRLAGPGLPDECHSLAGADLEVDALQGLRQGTPVGVVAHEQPRVGGSAPAGAGPRPGSPESRGVGEVHGLEAQGPAQPPRPLGVQRVRGERVE